MEFPEGLRVVPVQDDAALWEFIRFPWRIYQNDPYWVPPILSHQRQFLDPQHGPFFEIGEAQYFLALSGGRPLGRISAHRNRLHEVHHGPEAGFFGFFECVRDPRVAGALFEAAAAWLRARGKSRVYGPLNFSIYDEMGLLVEGFDSLPAFLHTHNPPYYPDLLTDLGFRKTMDWHALRLTRTGSDPTGAEERLQDIMARAGLTFTTYHPREMTRQAEEAYALFNEAWSPNWGHVPVTRRQFQSAMTDLKPILRPDLVNLILDQGRLVAFSIVVPDLNPLIQKLDGRLTLWGKLRLLYEGKYKPVRKVRALMLGVHQPYQRRGLHVAMILRTYLYLMRHTPWEMADLSLIPENLRHYMMAFQTLGAQRYKTFRVLEKEI
jgi:GNAT superfamily N-acetyltransferase